MKAYKLSELKKLTQESDGKVANSFVITIYPHYRLYGKVSTLGKVILKINGRKMSTIITWHIIGIVGSLTAMLVYSYDISRKSISEENIVEFITLFVWAFNSFLFIYSFIKIKIIQHYLRKLNLKV